MPPRRCLSSCLLLGFTALPAGAQLLRVYYPDIEQGSATLVVSPTGKALLIDAGTGLKDVDEGVEHFINDLIDAGVVSSVDYVVATHYDEDHIGRMENVFQYVPLSSSVVTYDRGTFGAVPSTFAYSDYSLISEVFYDYDGADNGFEWVELCNSGSETIDLEDFSLGYGGTTWTSGKYQLEGTIDPGEIIVVGGPSSDSDNGNPTYDQDDDFSPDIQNSGDDGDGVALFNVPAAAITTSSVPVDAVIYGPNNDNSLVDETGSANSPEVGDASAGSSIERTNLAGSWQVQAAPNPGATSVCGGS